MSYSPTTWQTGDTITASKLNNMESGISAASAAPLIETTYADLVSAVSGGTLVPGAQYRITDYVTVVNGKYDLSAIGASGYLHYAVSAGHQFDIIVTADSANTLNENARAILHSGDGYFADSNLSAWRLKYTIANDPTVHAWADPTNGKGVIYYMEDEYDNRAPYDFKNVMFPRYALAMADPSAETGSLVYDASTQPNRYGSLMQIFTALQSYMQSGSYVNPWNGGYDFAVGGNILGVIQFAEIDATYKAAFACDLYYTYDYWDGEAHSDLSLNAVAPMSCYGNTMEISPDGLAQILNLSVRPLGLNNSVFMGRLRDNAPNCNGNRLGIGALGNTFGANVWANVLGESSYGNTFGNSCTSNTFGDDCSSNTFGDDCSSNTFGDDCNSNTFGYSCDSNTFGYSCSSNTFGDSCYSNTFGDDCDSNTFGNVCEANTFGNYCPHNTFGYGCGYNTFGKYCDYNTLEGASGGVTGISYTQVKDRVCGIEMLTADIMPDRVNVIEPYENVVNSGAPVSGKAVLHYQYHAISYTAYTTDAGITWTNV